MDEKPRSCDAEDGKLDGRTSCTRRNRWIKGLGLALGILMIVTGILSAVLEVPQRLVDAQLRKAMILSPSSDIYQDWKDPVVPVYMKFFLFNVTNPHEIISGEKPQLQECGPYTFSMTAPKTNVTFYENHTVSYLNKYTLSFEATMSIGNMNDPLVLLNVPLASMASMMKEYESTPSVVSFMNDLVKYSGSDQLFTSHTPREILFGYRDPIFESLNSFDLLERSEFGFFMDFNDSDDGEFLVHTGADENEEAFHISKWNGKKSLTFWSSRYANMINGTDGSFLGRNLRKEDTPYMYMPQMCRSIKLEYVGDEKVKGIDTFRYRGAKTLFENSTIHPENKAFCVPDDNCYDSGVMNTSPCNEGAPSFVSIPHFLNAAEQYQSSVLGLSPDKDKHESYFVVEPKTGAVLKSHRRLQINIRMQPSAFLDQLKHVRDTIFPVLWLEGSAEIDDESACKIRIALDISNLIRYVSYVVICFGVFVVLISLYCYVNEGRNFVFVSLLPRKQNGNNVTVVRVNDCSKDEECKLSFL